GGAVVVVTDTWRQHPSTHPTWASTSQSLSPLQQVKPTLQQPRLSPLVSSAGQQSRDSLQYPPLPGGQQCSPNAVFAHDPSSSPLRGGQHASLTVHAPPPISVGQHL